MLDLTVRDGFASPAEVESALSVWPVDGWYTYGDYKRASVPGATLAEPIAILLHRMASLAMPGLIPDLGLWGAGLHEMPPGEAGLGWHTDAERHPGLGLGRSKSGVLYLCGDGDLEFVNGVRISPRSGRLVLFDGSVPHRVAGPVTQSRRSVALFWYRQPVRDGSVRATFEEP